MSNFVGFAAFFAAIAYLITYMQTFTNEHMHTCTHAYIQTIQASLAFETCGADFAAFSAQCN